MDVNSIAGSIAAISGLLIAVVATTIGFVQLRRSGRALTDRNEEQIRRVADAIALPGAEIPMRVGDRPVVVEMLPVEQPEQRILQAMERRAARRSEIQFQHYAEALRQSGIYFNISAVVGLVGFVLLIVGVALAFASLVEPGVVTGIGGALAEGAAALIFRQAAASKKDSQNNLSAMSETGEREDNRQMALIYVSRIGDENLRDQTMAGLARHSMALSDPRPISTSGADTRTSDTPTALLPPESHQDPALPSGTSPGDA